MSTIDLLTRVNSVLKKYEKYDSEKQNEAPEIATHDKFLQLYTTLEDDLKDALKKVAEAEAERNRAVVATLNAEVRRAKAAMRNELPRLIKLADRKVKGVKAEALLIRPDLASAFAARIEEVPDGINVSRKKNAAKRSPLEIRIDNVNSEDIMRSGAKEHSEESRNFQDEFELRRKKQDEGLQVIEEGLTTLKNMAEDIGEELSRQDPLVEEVDTKVEKAGSDLKSTNTRLKESVQAMRSSRNFCVDIILLVIILGIAAYLYKALKK